MLANSTKHTQEKTKIRQRTNGNQDKQSLV